MRLTTHPYQMYISILMRSKLRSADLLLPPNADVIIVRTCLIAADIILIYVTWSTVGRHGFRNSRRSFVGVLLRDGECAVIPAHRHKWLRLPSTNRLVVGTIYFV